MNHGICSAGRTLGPEEDGTGKEYWTEPCDNIAIYTIGTPDGQLQQTVCTMHRDLLLAHGMNPQFVVSLECAAGREISSNHDTRDASVDWTTPCPQEPVEAVQFKDRLVVTFCREHFDSLRDLTPEGALTEHDKTW